MNEGDLYELAKILGQLEHQDDGALCEVGAAAHCNNKQHIAGNVEII